MPLPLSPFPAVVGQQYQIVIIISINKWQQYANKNVNNNLSVWPFGEGGLPEVSTHPIHSRLLLAFQLGSQAE